MAVKNPYAAYKQTSIETKSAGELTLMLYEGCLKFIKRAEAAIEEGNVEVKNTNLIKAQNIIRELMVTLNTDVAVSADMMQMYDFILAKLVEANTANDKEALKHAETFVVDFRDTWKEVIKLDRLNRHSSGAATTPSGNTQSGNSPAQENQNKPAGSSQGQAVGRITPEKREVSSENFGNQPESRQPGPSGVSAINNRKTGFSTETSTAPGNPYAKANKAPNPNNPYAAAKRSAAAAGATGTSFRK